MTFWWDRHLKSFGPVFWIPGMVGARARGWQVDIRDHRTIRPLFSERYGHQPCGRHVGHYCFKRTRLHVYRPAPKETS